MRYSKKPNISTLQFLCSNELTHGLTSYLKVYYKNMRLSDFQDIFNGLLNPERAVTPKEEYLIYILKIQTLNFNLIKKFAQFGTKQLPKSIQSKIFNFIQPFSIIHCKNLFQNNGTFRPKTIMEILLKTKKHDLFIQQIILTNKQNLPFLHELLILSIRTRNLVVEEYLLKNIKLDPNKQPNNLPLPLLIAVSNCGNGLDGKCRFRSWIRLLLQYGTDPHKRCLVNWETPHQYCLRRGYNDLAKRLFNQCHKKYRP
jgi:hypothetical protein